MNKKNGRYHVRDFEKASQEFLSMLFEICEMHIHEDKDEHRRKAFASTAMAARGAIHAFLALLSKG